MSTDKVIPIESHARVTVKPGYVEEPVQAHLAGGPKRFRNHNEHPLSLAYHKGQLQGGIIRDEDGKPKYTSADRYVAGDKYRQIWEACQCTGRDSTNMDRVDGSRTDGLTIAQADAIRLLSRVTGLLSATDRQIVQYTCGEAWWPSQAVRKACGPSYADATIPRLNEALDHLIEALAKAKRS